MSHSKKNDFTRQFAHHGIGEDAARVIEQENLLPASLINKLHHCYPRYSILKEESAPMFTSDKNRYTGLDGFREIVTVLKDKGVDIGHIEERELFINVYRFLATKHVLNTINWKDYVNDSVFQLVFPQPGMMKPELIKSYMKANSEEEKLQLCDAYIRETNPHDGKQLLNKAYFENEEGDFEILNGSQHKYPQCFLIFDKTTQSCFAFCNYCFRHAQVRGDEDMFIQDDIDQVHKYLREHKEITDILITGGDGGFMPYSRMESYLRPIITDPELSHIRNIRVASRGLTFDPQMIIKSSYDKTLALYKELIENGIQMIWMGHFSGPKELMNLTTIAAVRRLRAIGMNIKSQSPIMKHISLFPDKNGGIDIDKSAKNWIDLGHVLMMLGIGFHSMYYARPTGEHHYFTAPLADINKVFSQIYRSLPSIGRPSRYISMTSSAGKTSMLGTVQVNGKTAFALKFNEARNMEWMDQVYLAQFDDQQNTIEKLKPFEGDKYFYTDELEAIEKSLER
jgi:L-lysine 2,3-aminomutase